MFKPESPHLWSRTSFALIESMWSKLWKKQASTIRTNVRRHWDVVVSVLWHQLYCRNCVEISRNSSDQFFWRSPSADATEGVSSWVRRLLKHLLKLQLSSQGDIRLEEKTDLECAIAKLPASSGQRLGFGCDINYLVGTDLVGQPKCW